jgi:ABC-type thiamine transport system substrate-binding protein
MRNFVVGLLVFFLLISASLVTADNLVIYNAGTPEMGDDLVRAFKAKHPGINVEVIRLGSGEIITRVKAEANRPQGDIIMAMAKENMEVVYDLLDSYKIKEDRAWLPRAGRTWGIQNLEARSSWPIPPFQARPMPSSFRWSVSTAGITSTKYGR